MMVYRYGALKPKLIGIDGEEKPFQELLDYQAQSNRFYNSLVEIERWRIAAQDLTELLQGDRMTDEQKQQVRLAYNAECRKAASVSPIGWGQKQAVTEMVAAAMKTRRRDEAKAARKAHDKNYHYIKRVMSVPRPRYRRFDGEGILQATVQSCTGLTTTAVVGSAAGSSGKHFAIGEQKAALSPNGKKRKGSLSNANSKHRTALLRLRGDLSLVVPIVYHRELPEAAHVIFARLAIERIGDRWVYSVHITVDAHPAPRQMGIGKCAINFGWRRVPEGVRVAYAVGEDGSESECVIPERLFGKMQHSESLRSLADEIADLYLGDSALRHKTRKMVLASPQAKHPELGREHFTHEMAGKHSAKDAEHWARRDRHLYQWERDEYKKALRQRREIFRLWARKIASQYDSCVVEDFDMRRVIERGAFEMKVPSARHYRFMVGPHYLRLEIKSVFGEHCEVLKPSKLSSYCHACGKACKWDRIRELWHDCEHCGASWDQDANNARNQLAESNAAAE